MTPQELTIDQIKAQIAEETGVSIEDQAVYCFEAAYTWMAQVLGADIHGLEMLPLQPGFWPWWTTHWNAVDRAYITSRIQFAGHDLIQVPGTQQYKPLKHRLAVLDLWETYHDPHYVRGNKALLEKSFHQYIKTQVSKQ